MTQISFKLKDDSQLSMIIEWLKNLDFVHEIETNNKKIKLTKKQMAMREDLLESLDWVERHQRGEVEGQTWENFITELNSENENHSIPEVQTGV